MKIDHCDFPEEVLYDLDSLTWLKIQGDGEAVVGATSLLVAIAGKLTKAAPRADLKEVARGRSLGTIQSPKYFGAIRTPVTGRISGFNEALLRRPTLMNSSPYGEGWFARLRPTDPQADMRLLSKVPEAEPRIRKLKSELRVRCFAAFPDYEMYEIGVECAAVLVRLNDLMERMEVSEVVHIVSDDPTAEIEMERWSYDTGQPVLESRREGNLAHFIVRKVS